MSARSASPRAASPRDAWWRDALWRDALWRAVWRHAASARAVPTAAGLVLGYLADLVVGDPARGHPVAAFGRWAGARERARWADDRAAGVRHVAHLVGGAALLGAALEAPLRRRPAARTALVAAGTWIALGGRSLRAEGRTLAALLADPDLGRARARLAHLCSREAGDLDAAALARATVESLAENTSDAVTAPLWWGAVAGVPGLLAYRAANTLDAMVGYRSPRYARFGWAAARLDDVLNYVPARVAAGATVALAGVVGGRPADAWRAVRRDAAAHPSPNAGVVEAAAAGALGVRLGGANTYDGVVQDRCVLGDGPPAGVGDVARAVRLCSAVSLASLAVAAAVAAARDTRGGTRP